MVYIDKIKDFLTVAKTIEQTSAYHKENLYVHTMRVADYLYKTTGDRAFVLAGLLHDTGKIETRVNRPGKGWTFYGHAKVSADNLKKYMSDDDSDYKLVYDIIYCHMVFYDITENGREKFIKKHALSDDIFEKLKVFNDADENGCIRDEALIQPDSYYYDIEKELLDFVSRN